MNYFTLLIFLALLVGPLIYIGKIHIKEWVDPNSSTKHFWEPQKIISVLVVSVFLGLTCIPVLIGKEGRFGMGSYIIPFFTSPTGVKGNPIFPFVIFPTWSLALTLFPKVVSDKVFSGGLFNSRASDKFVIVLGHCLYTTSIIVYFILYYELSS